MRVVGRKDIQSVKSAWSVLLAELRGIIRDVKRIHTKNNRIKME